MNKSSGSSRPCGLCIGMRKRWYESVSLSTGGVNISGLIHEVGGRVMSDVENCHVVLSCWVIAETSSNTFLSDWMSPVILSTACMTVV